MYNILGERREKDEKTYDAYKKRLTELKDLREKVKGVDTKVLEAKDSEIATLKQQLQDSDSTWKKTYDTEREVWAGEKKGFQDEIATLKGNASANTILGDLAKGMAQIEFNPAIPEEARTAMIKQVEAKVLKNAEIQDGKVVYKGENGSILVNDLRAPMSAEELMRKELAPILKTSTPGGGAATGKAGEIVTVKEGDTETETLVLDQTSFKTRRQFTEVSNKALLDLGIAKTDERFNKLKDAAYKEYKVGDLPLE